jgi:hypothetical protein
VVVPYQNNNIDRMLHLKHQLQIIRMIGEDTIVSYLMKMMFTGLNDLFK